MPSRFIITTQSDLLRVALAELTRLAPDVHLLLRLRNGAFLLGSERSLAEVAAAMLAREPVFVKHVMPVQAELTLSGRRQADLPAVLEHVRRIAPLAKGQRFAVQCRRSGTMHDYDAKDVEVFVGSALEAAGSVPVFSDLAVMADDELAVVSIYLFEDAGFVGFSTVRQNLNEHCDEHRIFSRHGRSVSRAEGKLMEALRKFRIPLAGGRALDLGAAPGGWTKVLADAGMTVVAVDPGALDEVVLNLAGVTHFRGKAEAYKSDGDFDLLVNDMNIDPERSAQAMVNMAPHLKPGAPAIMTVKFVVRNPARLLGSVEPILAPAYEVIKAKSLFHNRLEVTLLLRRR